MLRLPVVFQSSLYCMAALSSLMLAIAEERPLPTALGVPLAIVAFFFSERWGRVRLAPLWADVLGLLAFFAVAAELFGGGVEARLLSCAHLLVYLTWIVLFRQKGLRQYWQLAALCVLQVAVGALLTNHGIYGLLLICYFFWTVWTLSVFSLYQAQEQFERLHTAEPAASLPALAAGGGTAVLARGPGFARLALPEQSSRAVGTIQRDPQERWISLRFLIGTMGTACAALLLAMGFFLLIPRVWIGRTGLTTEAPQTGLLAMTGFTDRIQLGSFGQILESTEPVMEVRVFDDQTGQELDVNEYAAGLGYDEPLFRGAVMTDYTRGRWGRGTVGDSLVEQFAGLGDPDERLPQLKTARQEIRLQPIGTAILFGMAPALDCRLKNGMGEVEINKANLVMWLPHSSERTGVLAYTVTTPRALTPGTNLPGPWPMPLPPPRAEAYLNAMRKLPKGLERVRQLAHEVADADPPVAPAEQARRLERYLRDSGKYGYTLDSRILDLTVDPVEDFLFNRRSGHCEYFASALALMLRSIGIPARLVSGFKGGETGRLTRAFEVEQRHAHAWVEAYVDGEWITLDPTPAAARSASVQGMASRLGTWVELRRLMAQFWSDYVVNINFRQQHQKIYGPLQRWIKDARDALRGRGGRTATFLGALKDFLSDPSRWFSWQGGVFSFLILLLLSGLLTLVRRLWNVWRQARRAERTRQRQQRIRVAFYDRFQQLCAAAGLVRGPSETPREFAATVRQQLADLLSAAGAADLPDRLIALFYGIRYGQHPADDTAIAALDLQLTRLEHLIHTPADSGTP